LSPDGHSPDHSLLNAKDQYDHLNSYHQWIVKTTLGALTIIITVGGVIGGFLGYRSLSDVTRQAKSSVAEISRSVQQQISKIRDDSEKVARDEAQKRVDSAFRAENVQALVESAANREVGSAIQRQVTSEVERAMEPLQEEINTLGNIANLAMEMRIQLRPGMDGLIAESRNGRNERMRKVANDLLNSISGDYDDVIQSQSVGSGFAIQPRTNKGT
jgi:hypothetical protein